MSASSPRARLHADRQSERSWIWGSALVAGSLLAMVILAGCGSEPEPAATPELQRVENPALEIAVAGVPSSFEVTVNEGEALELVPVDAEGRVQFRAVEPEIGGVNLVEAIQEHKAAAEEAGGSYKGRTELQTHLGPAYISRARIPADAGGETEECIVFMLHPSGSKRLQLEYRYPAGDEADTRMRVQEHIIDLLSALEAMVPAA